MTKLKKIKIFSKNNLTPPKPMRFLRAAFRDLAMFWILFDASNFFPFLCIFSFYLQVFFFFSFFFPFFFPFLPVYFKYNCKNTSPKCLGLVFTYIGINVLLVFFDLPFLHVPFVLAMIFLQSP